MSTIREFVRSVLTEGQYVDISAWLNQVNSVLMSQGEPSWEEQGIPQAMLMSRFDRGDSPEKVVADMIGSDENPYGELENMASIPRTSRSIDDY